MKILATPAPAPTVRPQPLSPAEAWRQTPQGRYVLAMEAAWLSAALVNEFGFNALQLGMADQALLSSNRMPLRQIISEVTDPRAHLVADFTALPIASQSIDLLLLPHVLEFHPMPQQILREAVRVLIPEGRLFILGFSPFSLWGLRRRLPPFPQNYPWTGQYLSLPRLKDWLILLGMEADRGAFGLYAPPCKGEKWLSRWRFMEAAGDRWWGAAGSLYLIRAIKRVVGMRLIQPTWHEYLATHRALAPQPHKVHSNKDHHRYG
jgi:SAM-dependent methyltransferase